MTISNKELAIELASYSDGIFKYQYPDKGAQRITLTSPEIPLFAKKVAIAKILEKVSVLKVIPPGTIGACSGTFETYNILYKNTIFNLVFSGGKNAGILFETIVARELAQKSGAFFEEFSRLLNLPNYFTIKHHRGSKQRECSLFETHNIGEKIADFTLNYDGIDRHISLKDRCGLTISNIGYRGLLTFDDTGAVIAKPKDNEAEYLLTAVGVDKQRIVNGVESWRIKQFCLCQDNDKTISLGFPSIMLKKFLHSQVGFGYTLVKRRKKGGFFVKTFNNALDTEEFVGEPKMVKIGYPFYENEKFKRKQLSIWAHTSSGLSFFIEFRDTAGQLLPTQINTRLITPL